MGFEDEAASDRVTVALPPRLVRVLERRARTDRRTLSAFIRFVLIDLIELDARPATAPACPGAPPSRASGLR